MLYRIVDLYPDKLEIVHKSQDIMRIFKSGKCASLMGAEGLHQIGNSSSALRIFHRLGVRYVTLAHGKNNLYVDSAVSGPPPFSFLALKVCRVLTTNRRPRLPFTMDFLLTEGTWCVR